MILIPAYEPDRTLVSLVERLRQLGAATLGAVPEILVVNDGSKTDGAKSAFEELRASGTEIIEHPVNMGKGAALKTGIGEAARRGRSYVVTADADGQHLPEDILKVMAAGNGDGVVLGRRVLDIDAPLRSRFGNWLTAHFFGLLHGRRIQDTQTGLRYIPSRYFADLLAISQTRYDYEQMSLIHFVKNGEVKEVKITTVYEPGNPTSHFRKIQDSALIYFVLFRGALASLATTVLDFMTFCLVDIVTDSSLAALVAARSVAIVAYFLMARDFVFKTEDPAMPAFIKYAALVVLNVAILLPVIDRASVALSLPKAAIYAVSIVVLFLLNFAISKRFIFRKKRDAIR